MRSVYMITGGITKFSKAHPGKNLRLMVKEVGELTAILFLCCRTGS